MSSIEGAELPSRVETSELGETELWAQFELSEVEGDYLRQIEGLHEHNWVELPVYERLEVLRELEHRLADIEGRPPVPLSCENLGPGEFGFFDRGAHRMVISEALLRADSPLEAIDTVAHEGRHAFQHYAIAHPEIHDDPFEVAAWKENMENYLSAAMYGYEAYREQPVEADAWAFGDMIRNQFLTA